MTDTPALRASDADRERTIGLLREHTASGRLTLEEFTERMTAAYEATTTAELDVLAQDLPAVIAETRRASTLALSIFGDTELSGRIQLAGRLVSLSLFGDVALDLRHATLAGEVEIVAVSVFGDVVVYLPEGIELDIRSVSIFGDRTMRGRMPPPQPGTPLARMLWISLFGDLEVLRVPAAWTQSTLREIKRGLRRSRGADA